MGNIFLKNNSLCDIMSDKIKDRINLNLPSERYLKIVEEGYTVAGFDIRFIEEALNVSAEAISKNSI
ncbi:hypothetical protein [Clostridium cochlearium]|uniref:hypothetical protein n=1 Tax=Clostridium cochlearium TaxID=1494 RepID=UPI001EDEA520|nr:hypothetical protein [Clostridium cochlearium]MBV1819986.1 hypothetical protein [Bacteroidales bacterium MSK.15.36]MCG4580910.1 hypothetical protein [Clostridium cochlearium]